MTDIELLKLAAKAAGIKIEPCTCSNPKRPFRLVNAGWGEGHWNPLEKDDDALRLAVELGTRYLIFIEIGRDGTAIEFDGHDAEAVERGRAATEATRRAVVRAAAEVGKGMLTHDEFVLMFPDSFPEEEVERARASRGSAKP